VESDEFTEIEDPDPENHQQRQRELINEIEEARKEFEKQEKQSKGKFGFFSRKKKHVLEKKEWETYEEYKGDPNAGKEEHGSNEGVLFDIEAIRAELASEHMEVRELQSTLPPMKLDLGSPSLHPRSSLRATQSSDAVTMLKANDFKTSPFPSPRQSSSSFQQYGEEEEPTLWPDEEEVQMTFDTSYHSPPRSARTSFNPPRESFSAPSFSAPSFSAPSPPPLADPVDRSAAVHRPNLVSSNTLPAPTVPAISLDHNAWADDDDEDFGVEKEIEMTFA
jgi:hypothetical protein